MIQFGDDEAEWQIIFSLVPHMGGLPPTPKRTNRTNIYICCCWVLFSEGRPPPLPPLNRTPEPNIYIYIYIWFGGLFPKIHGAPLVVELEKD